MLSNQSGLVLSDIFRAHEGSGLPERPERIETIRKALVDSGLLPRLTSIPVPDSNDAGARIHAMRWILENHDPDYIYGFERSCGRGDRFLFDRSGRENTDTPISASTFDVTWRATSSVLQAVNQVAKGMLLNAFCTVRPPGHHAEQDSARGFCYVNHVAVAARYLLGEPEGFSQPDGSRIQFDRILIVDIDLHHGNGAQKSFFSNDKVMFCSFHGHPDHLWPGSGREEERGDHGTILNVPFFPGSEKRLFHQLFEERFLRMADDFKPQFILVSAGFDMHRGDPLNQADHLGTNFVPLDFEDFSRSAALLVDLSRRHCNGRLVSILEGGYNLQVLGPAVAAHVAELMKRKS